jgi:hypothetical protein
VKPNPHPEIICSVIAHVVFFGIERLEPAELAFPLTQCAFPYSKLADQFCYFLARLHLLQYTDDLFFAETRLLRLEFEPTESRKGESVILLKNSLVAVGDDTIAGTDDTTQIQT